MTNIYLVQTATRNPNSDIYEKNNREYFSSYKKAVARKDNIISVNNGSDITQTWCKEMYAMDMFEYVGDAWVSASKKIRLSMRVFISKEILK